MVRSKEGMPKGDMEAAKVEGTTLVPAMEDAETVAMSEADQAEVLKSGETVDMEAVAAEAETVTIDSDTVAAEMDQATVDAETVLEHNDEPPVEVAEVSSEDAETVDDSTEKYDIPSGDAETVQDILTGEDREAEPLPVSVESDIDMSEAHAMAEAATVESDEPTVSSARMEVDANLVGTPEDPKYPGRVEMQVAEPTELRVGDMNQEQFEAKMTQAASLGFAAMMTQRDGTEVAIGFNDYRDWKKEKDALQTKMDNAGWFKRTFMSGGEKARMQELDSYLEIVETALANAEMAKQDDAGDSESRDRVAGMRERQRKADEQARKGGRGKMAA